MQKQYSSFQEFYPDYLAEHRDPVCRRLHFTGSALVLATLLAAAATRDWRWLIVAPIVGYGFAWIGHFFFEHNRPATFHSPLYSLAADWVMFKEMLTGTLPAAGSQVSADGKNHQPGTQN
jgi:hypothetical protein